MLVWVFFTEKKAAQLLFTDLHEQFWFNLNQNKILSPCRGILRLSSIPRIDHFFLWKNRLRMVRDTGIEPVTPTMSM